MKNTLSNLVYYLLYKNNIAINKEELKFQIATHPSYPSLHAITGVLDHFSIENMALDIPQNNEVYEQLPKHFIAHLKNEDGEEIAFVEKTNTSVKIKFQNKKNTKLTKKQFLQDWTGIVVVIDEEEIATNTNKFNTGKIKYLPLVFLVGIIIYSITKYATLSIFNILHILLSLTGIYISVLLIKHELGINSQTISKLCTSSEKTSCDAVLNSKAATLFGLFKISDLTFIYFSSIAISGLMLSLVNNNLGLISTISLIAVPVIVYSVYYQGFVIKKWCPLCLATGSILLVQALISYFLTPLIFSFEIKGLLILTISILIFTVLYSTIKPIISSKITLLKSKIEYYKFKHNFSLFNALYSKNPILNTSINNLDEIVFGNKNAKIELVAITNPMCGFCKNSHQAIDKLLNSNSANIKATIRFNISTDDKENISYKIANILLNLYQKDKIACKEAMHQIYTDGVDVEKWIATHEDENKTDYYQVLETEKQWCTNNNINFTPAVYLNNKEYPKEYDLSDLSFFIDDLSHLSSSQKEETKKQAETKMLIKNKNVITKHNVIPTE